MHILLIEDDQLLRKGMGTLLLEWGYEVSSAKNGEEALNMVHDHSNVDVVICDIFMPEISGPTFLLKLKKVFAKKFPKIVLMSAVKKPSEFLQKIDVAYDVFLQKPIDFVHLKNVLATLPK